METTRDAEFEAAPYPDEDPSPDEILGKRESAYATYSRAEWDEQEDALEALHTKWVRNLLFLAGHQWWERNPHTNEWNLPKAPDWRQRPVVNLSIAHFKTWVAKILKNKPASQAVAASSEPKDLRAAELAEQVIKAKYQELRFARILRRTAAWIGATGNGFILPYWNTDTGRLRALTVELEVPSIDPATGEPAIDPETMEPATEWVTCPCDENGEPYRDAEGQPDLTKTPAYVDEGDLGFRVISPFQVRVNPDAEDDEDVRVVLIGDPMTMREIRQRWPEAEVVAEDMGNVEQYDRMIAGIAGAVGDELAAAGRSRSADNDMPKALVIHRYEKQSPDYPKGRYWITCGNVLLEAPGELPENQWPPLYHFHDIVMPGSYHASSSLDDAVRINREYNELNGSIKEAQKSAMSGAWITEKGAGVRKNQITTEPHLVIEVNTGFINGIKHVARSPVPSDVLNERERVRSDFEMVSGIRRISMGEAPSGVTSGVAFLQLEEADNTDLGPVIEDFEDTVADLWHAGLKIIRKNYTDERLIRVPGPSRRYLVKAFKGADLEGVHDIIAVPGSASAWSHIARQGVIMELGQKMPQLFTDPTTGQFDSQKFLEKLEIAGLDAMTGSHDMDMAEALREEEAIEEFVPGGELPEVMPWQNHVIHILSHEKVLKGAEFLEWEPSAQMAMMRHHAEHALAMAQAMAPPPNADPNADPSAPPGGGAPV